MWARCNPRRVVRHRRLYVDHITKPPTSITWSGASFCAPGETRTPNLLIADRWFLTGEGSAGRGGRVREVPRRGISRCTAGISRIRLLTNDPAKIRGIENGGVRVAERIPIIAGETPANAWATCRNDAKSPENRVGKLSAPTRQNAPATWKPRPSGRGARGWPPTR
ncbi:hypothetical protein KO481_01920 [Nocardia sp. NEAU-G5]|uniref:GTP cyclohydrolase II domain-containing protein n=1 Tax=Nocardia albiluteola TaxID=2842303 RepID=A0ABS6AQI9_9NOCA|nr:hypothetical protein [Nocardia albiluteola]